MSFNTIRGYKTHQASSAYVVARENALLSELELSAAAWCLRVGGIAEKPTKIASDDDPEYLPDTFSTLLSLVSSAKIFQVIVEILLQCFSAQYTINTEFFTWNKVFDDKLFFLQNQALILLKKSLI